MTERLWRLLGSEENVGGGRVVNYSINHCDQRTFFFIFQLDSLVVPISH